MLLLTSNLNYFLRLLLVTIMVSLTASADELDRALQGAFQGPEQKFVDIFGHEFHLKPIQVVKDSGGTVTEVGVISHHLSLRPDDQITYRVTCKDDVIVDVKKEINRGIPEGIIGNIGSAIAKYFGVNIDPNLIEGIGRGFGKLVDKNWESACDYLVANIALHMRSFVTPPEFGAGVLKKTVNPISYIPPHVWADREFDGHGPDVSVSTSLSKINNYMTNNYEIRATCI